MAEVKIMKAGWLLQKKYDGCFGMAIIRGNGFNQMLSRTGEDYTTSCLHILEEIEEAATEQSGSRWDEFAVLGEVWHPTLAFPTISGQFRKRAVSELRFVANDILPVGLTTDRPYYKRLNDLKALLPTIVGARVYVSTVDQPTGGQV